ncbi:hypothetical protein HNR60_000893 [Rhodopseudomonas rhenobacensis]|uniref:Tat (Twin-arginine translocation) pathway signal sequence n=1 Tax=Rhodopseudomonas rhenobacensis TaxID=87461 RepID=A0A7W7Z192_9BRAD|nr:hypothetical protein [Rhodopseudomonas rhenobacensis]MBB5046151.1 hypothetical protein [Rhodopseudomonas rhenobacensis]
MTDARPMFPPVDTSRRGFLTHTAALAAASTAMALAAPLPPAEAAGVAPIVASEAVDPFFIEIKAEIDERLTQWHQLDAKCKIGDRALKAWEARNPLPDMIWDEAADEWKKDIGTIRSDWHERRQKVMWQTKVGELKGRRNEVEAAYCESISEFAAIPATNLPVLIFKIETGIMMDSRDGTIARSVLFDIARLRRSGDFLYDAANSQTAQG